MFNTASKKIVSIISLIMIISAITIPAFSPAEASERVFGGAAGTVIPCFNDVIWTNISAPRGGKFIWAPGVTRTYDYGAPKHGGQWLLGLYGASYFCIVSPWPLIIFPGKLMLMLGSST